MEKRIFGKTGLSVSVLGFGGAEIGYRQEVDAKTVEKTLMEAIEYGLNVIDTAECYDKSEELIGAVLGKKRKDIYLFTKCGHGKSWDDDAWDGPDLEKSIDRSLKRLKTDYVDLLQLHSCSQDVLEKGEAIEVLQKAKKAGKTRFIGYSGDGNDALYAIKTGIFDTLQTSVNIADQEPLELTLPLAVEKGMGVIAKRPVANVAFKYKKKPDGEYCLPYWERLQKLKYNFINGDINQAAALALRFTLSVPGIHTAIVGTAKPGRYAENAKILEGGLISKSDFDNIRLQWQNVATAQWVGQV